MARSAACTLQAAPQAFAQPSQATIRLPLPSRSARLSRLVAALPARIGIRSAPRAWRAAPAPQAAQEAQKVALNFTESRAAGLRLEMRHDVDGAQRDPARPSPVDFLDPALQAMAHHGVADLAAGSDA
jgi:hypothetical protein